MKTLEGAWRKIIVPIMEVRRKKEHQGRTTKYNKKRKGPVDMT